MSPSASRHSTKSCQIDPSLVLYRGVLFGDGRGRQGVCGELGDLGGGGGLNTIDTRIEAKRNNTISKLISFRITKAKAKFGVKYLCERECERSSVPINIHAKAKATKYFLGNQFHLNFGGNVFFFSGPKCPPSLCLIRDEKGTQSQTF